MPRTQPTPSGSYSGGQKQSPRGRVSTAATIANVRLPEKSLYLALWYNKQLTKFSRIKCRDCKVTKQLVRFSNKQRSEYQSRIYFKGEVNAERPSCSICTGGPASERECHGCGIVKAMEKFSKAQRAKDNGRCWDCTQERLDQDPNLEEAIREEEIADAYRTKGNSVFGSGTYTAMASTPAVKTLSKSKECGTDAGDSESGRVRIQPELGPLNDVSSSYGRRGSSSGESVKSDVTNETTLRSSHAHHTFSSTYRSQQRSRVSSTGNNRAATASSDKWVKQNAVPKSMEVKAMTTADRKTRQENDRAEQFVADGDEDDSEDDFQM